jgi:hypothetical protein
MHKYTGYVQHLLKFDIFVMLDVVEFELYIERGTDEIIRDTV